MPASASLRRRGLLILGAAALIAAGVIAWRWPWALRYGLAPTPAVADAVQTWTSSTAYRFEVPQGQQLVRIGPPPTPISLVKALDTEAARILFYYETLGPLLLVLVDKRTGAERELSVPGAGLAYQAIVDRSKPDRVWIATSLAPKLLSLDVREGKLRERSAFAGTHVFALDQAADGALWVGTYPGPHCFRLSGEASEEIPIDAGVLGGRAYLHELFATERGVLMHFGSPGRLARYHPEARSFEVILDAGQPFLGFSATASTALVTWTQGSRAYARSGLELATAEAAPPLPAVGLRRARSLGMSINFLGALGAQPLILGGSYWNHWIFTVDPERHSVDGLGELPEGSGEIFSAAAGDGLAWLPSYQGDLYAVDPKTAAFQKKLHVAKAHFGRATVLNQDHLIYSTNPNYDQAGGMLIQIDPRTMALQVLEHLEGDATLGTLALLGDLLFGGTMTARGLGLAPLTQREIPRIFAFGARDLQPQGSVRCGTIFDDITGLVPVGEHALFAATARGQLFRVDTAPLACHQILDLRVLKQGVRQLVRRDAESLYLLTRGALFVYHLPEQRLELRTKLPFDARFIAVAASKDVYLATRESLYLLPAK